MTPTVLARGSGTGAAPATGLAVAGERTGRPLLAGAAADWAFTLAAGLLALTAFGAAYGGRQYLAVGAAGLLIGAAVADLGIRARQPVLLVVAEGACAYFLFGAIAVPAAALGHVLPSPASVAALAGTPVHGWRSLLAISPVVGNAQDLLVLPFLCCTAAGISTMILARRAPRWPLALLPPVALLTVAVLFGTDARPSTVLTGGGILVASLAFGAGRVRSQPTGHAGSASRLRPLLGATLVVGSAAAGVALSPHVPLSGSHVRWVLRDHVTPPLDVDQYPSPLSAFRAYRMPAPGFRDKPLLTVSGVPAGSKLYLRLAIMDAYDGHVFLVQNGSGGSSGSGDFADVGSPVSSVACPPAAPCGRPVDLTVQVRDYAELPASMDVWVADAGIVRSVTFSGPQATALRGAFRYNTVTDAALDTAGLQAGETYSMVVDVPVPSASAAAGEAVAAVPPPQTADVPPVVASTATKLTAGAQTDFQRASMLAEKMRTGGAYSDGFGSDYPTLPGHSAFRIAQFLELPQMVGDAEQYAAAMALMADSLGLPARVVLGAELQGPGAQTVTGADVTAWVEVDFAGVGWYPFFPTPPIGATLRIPPRTPPQSATSAPHQYRPPLTPSSGETAASADSSSSVSPHHVGRSARPAASSAVLLAVLLPLGILLLLALPVAFVLGSKARRRRRRRRATGTGEQVAGAWAEVVDRARDLGRQLPDAATRYEQAGVLGGSSPTVAAATDRAVFGPVPPSPDEVAGYWRRADELIAELTGDVPAWRRARARVSTTSLR